MAEGNEPRPLSMSFYENKEQLGFTDKTTLQGIVTAMPSNSILQCQADNTLLDSEFPISNRMWGVLVVFKCSNSRWVAKYYSQYATNDQYYEYAKSGIVGTSPVITSWKQIYSGV